MEVKKVGIIVRRDSSEPRRIAAELEDWFGERSIAVVVDDVQDDLDLLVILGGDGTLLHVAEQASFHSIPVVGINLGDLGFLTEVGRGERLEALEAILAGDVVIEKRMMLKARLASAASSSPWYYALNDVVLSKGSTDRLIRLGAWADNDYITTYRADGLIFSTPTGATAYNLSAGGPIVHPSLNSILVTPICPFMLDSRPVLLAPETKMKTSLVGGSEKVTVIIDGTVQWDMCEGDLLEVESAEKPLQLIGSLYQNYFDILRNKLNWGGSERL